MWCSGTSVKLALSKGTLTSGTTPITTDATGQAVFSDLVEDKVGTYSLVASASWAEEHLSNKFKISVGKATALTFLTPPKSTTAGATLSPFIVAVVDQFGNVVAKAGTVIMISENGLTTGPYITNAYGKAIIGNWTDTTVGYQPHAHGLVVRADVGHVEFVHHLARQGDHPFSVTAAERAGGEQPRHRDRARERRVRQPAGRLGREPAPVIGHDQRHDVEHDRLQRPGDVQFALRDRGRQVLADRLGLGPGQRGLEFVHDHGDRMTG